MGLSTRFVVPKIHVLWAKLCYKLEFWDKNLWISLISWQSKRMCSRNPSILYQAYQVMLSSLWIQAKIFGVIKILTKILKLISQNLVILQLTSILWKICSHSGISRGNSLKKVHHFVNPKGFTKLSCSIFLRGKRSSSFGTNVPGTLKYKNCVKLVWKAQHKR